VLDLLLGHARPGGLHEHTVLLVLGDHGQTMTGDHGGGSAQEVDTPLLAVNLAVAAAELQRAGSHSLQAALAAQCERAPTLAAAECHVTLPADRVAHVAQLDFAASLSALLGLPIPYESVGAQPAAQYLHTLPGRPPAHACCHKCARDLACTCSGCAPSVLGTCVLRPSRACMHGGAAP
jgi:hypothetical protein